MNDALWAYVYALSSVVTFSTAAIGFTWFSRKVSALWMNIFKCAVSLLVCLPIIFYLHGTLFFEIQKVWPFLLSGFIGLNVGDWFLLSAYKRMGPGRTLILFGFQPFIAGSFSWYFWGEKIFPIQFVAILFFIICLFLFSYERFKKYGQWEVQGLALAASGVLLDSIGVILTRYAFDQEAMWTGFDAQYFRCFGAMISFVIYLPFVKIDFFKHLKSLTHKEKGIAVVSSFFGTFLSLVFYMQAIKLGKLATVTSIVLTDPVFSTFMECLWLRLWPSRYLWLALLSFLAAMFCLMQPQWAGLH